MVRTRVAICLLEGLWGSSEFKRNVVRSGEERDNFTVYGKPGLNLLERKKIFVFVFSCQPRHLNLNGNLTTMLAVIRPQMRNAKKGLDRYLRHES